MKESQNHEAILRYLDTYGVRNKDGASGHSPASRCSSGISKTVKGRLRKTVDLHGLRSDEAELRLARAVEECRKKGVTELLIIHGWGQHSDPSTGGVLKKMVRDNLEYRYNMAIRSWKTALPKDGGEGATLVTMG
jgi:DNA-nicking Smr family endonuclease